MTHKNKKYRIKLKIVKARLIGFANRSMESLVRAIEILRARYKKVSLNRIRLVNGLYKGFLSVS